MTSNYLRLSPHVQPQIRVGGCRLLPQNMSPDEAPLRFAAGLIRHLERLLDMPGGDNLARGFVASLPFARGIVEFAEEGGRAVPRLRQGAEDRLVFRTDRLAVLLLDGRKRDATEHLMLRTGRRTAAFLRWLRSLVAGKSETVAAETAKQIGLRVTDLVDEGILERASAPWQPPDTPAQDAVAWIGHAFVMAAGAGKTLWVDPVLPPRMEWRADEREELFCEDFPDRLLHDAYGPDARQITRERLAPPDAVLLTHQDADHVDLGTLGLLPETAPIVVPEWTGHPWDVDLSGLIREVLGPERVVVPLGHGQSFEVGKLRVTAFPFSDEFPRALEHRWNCYHVELEQHAVALTADSVLGDAQMVFLKERSAASGKPLCLFAREPGDQAAMAGYREEPARLWNPQRRWGWYLPVVHLFDDIPAHSVDLQKLGELAEQASLRSYFPYACGCTPFHRFHDRDRVFDIRVGNPLTRALFEELRQSLPALHPGLRLLPAVSGRFVAPVAD